MLKDGSDPVNRPLGYTLVTFAERPNRRCFSSVLVEADPSGGICVATGAGLVRFDGANWTIYNQGNTGMPGKVVSDVARRPSDGLIAIANNEGSNFPYHGVLAHLMGPPGHITRRITRR